MAEADIATSPEAELHNTVSLLSAGSTHEFIRYFFAALFALLLDVGGLWLLVHIFNLPYLLAGGLSFSLGIVCIYVLSVLWVFEQRGLRDRKVEFLIFVGIGLIGLIINEAILWFFTSALGFFYLISKIVSVVVVFLWNYSARKMILFRKKP